METKRQGPQRPSQYSSRLSDNTRPSPNRQNADVQPRQYHGPLRLRLASLPHGVTTKLIHNNLQQYGTITRIKIIESTRGGASSVAEVDFEQEPSTRFWPGSLNFYDSQSHAYNVHVQKARYQPESRIVELGATKRKYPEKIVIDGECLDFGYLSSPGTMQIMHSCDEAPTATRMILLPEKMKIDLHFTFSQTSTRTKARSFRFFIALDEPLRIWQVAENKFVLHLTKTPPYSKKLDEAKDKSHSQDGRFWSEEDLWARQTDICKYIASYKQLERTFVGLPKPLNAINISRWTTFQFHVSSGNKNLHARSMFLDILKHTNNPVLNGGHFNCISAAPTLERDTWSLINGYYDGTDATTYDQEMSRIQLPFSVRYQLEVCLSHGWLSEYSITKEFLERLNDWGEAKARQALVYVATNCERLHNPMVVFNELQYSKPVRAKKLPDNCIEVHSATITATGILFHTPSVEITNRIVRKYKHQAHRFLRVRFEDDDYRGQSRIYASLNNRMVTVFNRVKRALTYGIKLGEVHYKFLAWGNSQLREHGVHFVAPTADMNADRIREEMGSFQETVVAKKAARMGQCFSTTKPVRLGTLPKIDATTTIPDIKRGRFVFTDGVGKISKVAAQLVSKQLNIKGQPPSLFQFRLGGCKGVLAVAEDMEKVTIAIRDSQLKFNSLSGELEIIRWAEFWQPYLNRQIILCLDFLGVPRQVFLRMQDYTIDQLRQTMFDDDAATKALRNNVDPNMMTLTLCEFVEAGFRRTKEPFVTAILHLWRAWSMKYLKEKAKIPVEKGAFVLGCVDETATLRGHTSACPSGDRNEIEKDPAYLDKLPQIFCQKTDATTGEVQLVEGLCILARNPSLHPGDIRVVNAVNIPALRHMRDVVVMPQTGDRDLPSMCSGGDLDGDDYIVIWDPDLIPQTWNVEPFHYEPPPPKKVASAITTVHLIDFFLDYLRYDALGRIAHAHLAAADYIDYGLNSRECHELVELHSQAVDYPKSGVPAVMQRRHERQAWPHFMEKKNRKSYHSRKVLGQLYDAVTDLPDSDEMIGFRPNYTLNFDPRILNAYHPPADLCARVRAIKVDYDNSLRRVLTQHDIKTEFELWSTFVLTHSKASRDYKFHEEVGNLSKVLKDQYHVALSELAGGTDFEHLAPVAVAAYRVTQEELTVALEVSESQEEGENRKSTSMPFISFPWILHEHLTRIALRAGDPESRTTTMLNSGETAMGAIISIVKSNEDDNQVADTTDLDLSIVNFAQHLSDPLLLLMGNGPHGHKEEGSILQRPTPTSQIAGLPSVAVNVLSVPADVEAEHSESEAQTALPIAKPDAIHTDAHIPADLAVKTEASIPWDNGQRAPSQEVVSNLEQIHEHDFCTISEADGHYSTDRNSHSDTSGVSRRHSVDSVEPQITPRKSIKTCPQSKNGACLCSTEECKLAHYAVPGKDFEKANGPCFYWQMGHCQFSAKDCQYVHGGEHRRWTCFFWASRRKCSNGDSCLFAHYDTGYYAPPPKDKFRAHSAQGRSRPTPIKRTVRDDVDSDNEVPVSPYRPMKSVWAKRTPIKDSDSEHECLHILGIESVGALQAPTSTASIPNNTKQINSMARVKSSSAHTREVDEYTTSAHQHNTSIAPKLERSKNSSDIPAPSRVQAQDDNMVLRESLPLQVPGSKYHRAIDKSLPSDESFDLIGLEDDLPQIGIADSVKNVMLDDPALLGEYDAAFEVDELSD